MTKTALRQTPTVLLLSILLWVILSGVVPHQAKGQSVEEMAIAGLSASRPGLVLALVQDGKISFLDAYGAPGRDSTEVLTREHLFPFPALSELMATVLVQALGEADVLDPGSPIARYFPLISRRLGTITLSHLISHSAGLDDAQVPESFSWAEVMDQLNDAVLFTEPGSIQSRSRYSFPLAVRAIEKAVDTPFQELVEATILQPLGMASSTFDLEVARARGMARGVEPIPGPEKGMREVPASTEFEGLPVLFTTGEDVLRFLAAWMGGGIKGDPPWAPQLPVTAHTLPSDVSNRGGFQVKRSLGHVRATREARGLGLSHTLHLFPEAKTALVILASGYPPTGVQKLALERLEAGLAPGSPETAEESLARFEPTFLENPEGGWIGRYLNGDRKVELAKEGQGWVYRTNVEDLDVEPDFGGNMVAIQRATGRKVIFFKLVLDKAGKRYAVVEGKAFIHEKDARVYPHGGG